MRETIAKSNYEIKEMSFTPSPFPNNYPFLNSRISANHVKVDGLSANDGEIS